MSTLSAVKSVSEVCALERTKAQGRWSVTTTLREPRRSMSGGGGCVDDRGRNGPSRGLLWCELARSAPKPSRWCGAAGTFSFSRVRGGFRLVPLDQGLVGVL